MRDYALNYRELLRALSKETLLACGASIARGQQAASREIIECSSFAACFQNPDEVSRLHADTGLGVTTLDEILSEITPK